MSADDIKELKAITLQILKNQTLLIAHLVSQSQEQPTMVQQQLQQPIVQLKQVKTEPHEQPIRRTPTTTAMKRKVTPKKEPLKEVTSGGNKRLKQSAGKSGNAKAGPEHPTNFCSICMGTVRTNLVQHIWEHIMQKVKMEKGPEASVNVVYSFMCDVEGCQFRTNKLHEATAHSDKHPEVERNQIVLDNRENTEPLFLATLAQCYERMSDVEKDEIYQKRYE